MGRNSVESIIEDFIKGARQGGFKGSIQVQRDGEGRSETKLANFGGGMPPGMMGGAPAGGGMPPDGMGSGGGMPMGGGDMSGGIEQLIAAHPELLQLLLAQLSGSPMGGGGGMPPEMAGGGMPPGLGGAGGGGGGMPPGLGGEGGGEGGPPKEKKDKKESKGDGDDKSKEKKDAKGPPKKEHDDGDADDKCAGLRGAYDLGIKRAFQKFGFLGAMAGMLAGPAARAAVPQLGKRLGSGLGSMAFDAAAGLGANAAIDRMGRPPGP